MTDDIDAAYFRHMVPAGTTVGIVAPGGYAPDEEVLAQGVANLEAQGCIVKLFFDPADKFQRFAATDAARAQQLMDAAQDPDVQIVMALRGAYGMSRILPLLDFKVLADSDKLFVGYSDITALHLGLLAQQQTISFAGPMLYGDFGAQQLSAFTLRSFWRTVTSNAQTIAVQAEGNPEVATSGLLWGGNLAMIVHLLGTPYFPYVDGGILFVEDVNEHPYRVERMLLQLAHAGVLEHQKAVILGDFSRYRLTDYDNGYDAAAMLDYLRATLPVPVLTGLPFGHIPDRVTLPVGAHAELTSDAEGFALTVTSYPHI
jgi:muramoyltetrapeptide carboxypeptidase